jgi:oligopeptide/dipeptide ABC transporter ATP-binding protein
MQIKDLTVAYPSPRGRLIAVDSISLDIAKGEILGLAGESGCGKSTTGLAIPRLTKYRGGSILGGQVLFNGEDLLQKTDRELERIRGNKISVIFQDPTSYLNPTLTIGFQIEEAIISHKKFEDSEVQARMAEILRTVGIPTPEKRHTAYPHEFSGGMRQRAMIAMALACGADLVIADEPTTNLDVTVEKQILDRFRDLRSYAGYFLYITHNLAVLAQLADRIAIMYAGNIVEVAKTIPLFEEPLHPYTQMLLDCIPRIDRKRSRALGIEGTVADLVNPPPGCRFGPRCPFAKEICLTKPEWTDVGDGHQVFCHRFEEIQYSKT